MLTRLVAKNFKRFGTLDVELGSPVVFVGPNDSGKTTALQALALWGVCLSRWSEKRGEGSPPARRPGVTINRNDLFPIPVPEAKHLWQGTHIRRRTKPIRIDLTVYGVTEGVEWDCGLELDYLNDQSFYCRPLRLSEDKDPERMEIPSLAREARIAYLPSMSGLTGTETRLDPGAINVRIGEGRTAEVLRNLCVSLYTGENGEKRWGQLTKRIEELFGITLDPPQYVRERGEVTMSYQSREGARLDLSSTGRGLQQTLLLMSYLMTNRGAVLLLDEPDAHLEILRQRQIYQTLTEVAGEEKCQIVAASHSEVILNEAAGRDVVIAFVGKPHRIDDRGSQAAKALKFVGFDQYFQAEQTGWILYLEGSTDLACLAAFAERLEHSAADVLARPFVKYVANLPSQAAEHFYALKEAHSDLVAFALYDRLDGALEGRTGMSEHIWRKREIENYFCTRELLIRWTEEVSNDQLGPLFVQGAVLTMEESIKELEDALATLNHPSPWSDDIKVTDDFLDPLFDAFFRKLNISNLMRKSDYHQLARLMEPEEIDSEIVEVLDGIVAVSGAAKGAGLPDGDS